MLYFYSFFIECSFLVFALDDKEMYLQVRYRMMPIMLYQL